MDACECQLNNYNFYRKLDHNPIQEHVNLINNALDEFKDNNELSPEIADGLKPLEPKTPRLYMLPKIHKEGNPGRPVVSSVNCHTSDISKLVDYHIQLPWMYLPYILTFLIMKDSMLLEKKTLFNTK